MNTHKRFWLVKSCWLAIAATLLLISGCATLNIEQPKVSVTRLAPASSGSSLGTLFEIDLKIANPNGVALPIKGMSYSLAINGAELLFGTSNQIPTIPAYGSETVIALTGRDGGDISSLLDVNDIELRADLNSRGRIHEVHMLTIFCLCDLIDHRLFGLE